MPLRKCYDLCTTHFHFPKRYEPKKTVEDQRRYNRERMRAWRKGIKLPKPSYKTHLYCSICKVWILRTEGYSKCPCCFSKLRGLKVASITIKEHFLKVLFYSALFILIEVVFYCVVITIMLCWMLFL